MRIAIIALAVFLIALGGGTGAAFLRRPKPVTALTADSTAQPKAAGADTTPPPETPDSAAAEPIDSTPAPHALDSLVIKPVAATLPSPGGAPLVTPPAAQTPLDQVQAYAQMARILAKMKPVEAQQILARLSNDQVERLIRQLSVRQAAAMLALLPADRAAALSRSMLVNFKGATR